MSHPLDNTLETETAEGVRINLEVLTRRLMKKYNLPLHGFVRELVQRLRNGEICDEPDVVRWQAWYAVAQDWCAKESV